MLVLQIDIEFSNKGCILPISLSGVSCRTEVTKCLCRQYETLSKAEEDLKMDYVFTEDSPRNRGGAHQSQKLKSHLTWNLSHPSSNVLQLGKQQVMLGTLVQNLLKLFKCSMSPRLKKQLLNYLFKLYINDFYSFVKSDFLDISLNAMHTLKSASKFNLLHFLSRCFFRNNEDAQLRMPVNRMPWIETMFSRVYLEVLPGNMKHKLKGSPQW